jgi:hypothetical protein
MNKKRYIVFLSLTMLATLVLNACGSVVLESNREIIRGTGSVVEENRSVSGISGVELAVKGDMHIEVGDSESLRIEAQENLLDHIKTEVIGGRLVISVIGDVEIRNTKPVDYYLTVKELDTIKVLSVGNIEAPDLHAEKFTIAINSTGDVKIDSLTADTLEVDIRSTGDLDIAGGVVKSQKINIVSTGHYSAENLASDEADVRSSSTGTVTVWVKEQLTARLNSTGDVRYRGGATVDGSANSTGKVIHLGD